MAVLSLFYDPTKRLKFSMPRPSGTQTRTLGLWPAQLSDDAIQHHFVEFWLVIDANNVIRFRKALDSSAVVAAVDNFAGHSLDFTPVSGIELRSLGIVRN
jgi:hypothetical protein